MWKPLPKRRVLKILRERLKGKVQRRQYLPWTWAITNGSRVRHRVVVASKNFSQSSKKTISANSGLGQLQMAAELDTE